MKYRMDKNPLTDEAEAEIAAEIRGLAAPAAEERKGPPDAYWQNLIVKVNRRIDHATSGRALSISWAARVAIPGVVSIVSFLIALHYYVPEPVRTQPTVADLVLSLPPAAIDSLLVDPSRADPSLSIEDVATDIFVFSRDQIAEYFFETGNAAAAVDAISDREASALITVLASEH